MSTNISIRKTERDIVRLIVYFDRLSRKASFQKDLKKLRDKHRIDVAVNKPIFRSTFMNTVAAVHKPIYSLITKNKALKDFETLDIRSSHRDLPVAIVTPEDIFLKPYKSRFQDVTRFALKWNIRSYEAMHLVAADVYPPYFGMHLIPRPFEDYRFEAIKRFRKDNKIREQLWPERVNLDKLLVKNRIVAFSAMGMKPSQICDRLAKDGEYPTEDAVRKIIQRQQTIGQ